MKPWPRACGRPVLQGTPRPSSGAVGLAGGARRVPRQPRRLICRHWPAVAARSVPVAQASYNGDLGLAGGRGAAPGARLHRHNLGLLGVQLGAFTAAGVDVPAPHRDGVGRPRLGDALAGLGHAAVADRVLARGYGVAGAVPFRWGASTRRGRCWCCSRDAGYTLRPTLGFTAWRQRESTVRGWGRPGDSPGAVRRGRPGPVGFHLAAAHGGALYSESAARPARPLLRVAATASAGDAPSSRPPTDTRVSAAASSRRGRMRRPWCDTALVDGERQAAGPSRSAAGARRGGVVLEHRPFQTAGHLRVDGGPRPRWSRRCRPWARAAWARSARGAAPRRPSTATAGGVLVNRPPASTPRATSGRGSNSKRSAWWAGLWLTSKPGGLVRAMTTRVR